MLDLLTHDETPTSGRAAIHRHHLLCAHITISTTEWHISGSRVSSSGHSWFPVLDRERSRNMAWISPDVWRNTEYAGILHGPIWSSPSGRYMPNNIKSVDKVIARFEAMNRCCSISIESWPRLLGSLQTVQTMLLSPLKSCFNGPCALPPVFECSPTTKLMLNSNASWTFGRNLLLHQPHDTFWHGIQEDGLALKLWGNCLISRRRSSVIQTRSSSGLNQWMHISLELWGPAWGLWQVQMMTGSSRVPVNQFHMLFATMFKGARHSGLKASPIRFNTSFIMILLHHNSPEELSSRVSYPLFVIIAGTVLCLERLSKLYLCKDHTTPYLQLSVSRPLTTNQTWRKTDTPRRSWPMSLRGC